MKSKCFLSCSVKFKEYGIPPNRVSSFNLGKILWIQKHLIIFQYFHCSFVIMAVIFGMLGNVWSREREELIPQKGRNTTCHCMTPQLCPRVLVRYTKFYLKAEKENQKECPNYKEKCCEPSNVQVVKILDLLVPKRWKK